MDLILNIKQSKKETSILYNMELDNMELDNMDNIFLKKALKYFLKLKENESNDTKGIGFANKSLSYINMIQNKKKFNKVIIETEEYCNNFIKSSVILENVETIIIKYDDIFKLIKKGNLDSFKNIKINPKELTKNNGEGTTPLHYCIMVGDTTILKKLLNYDVSINTINSRGNTLIEYACLCGDPNMVKFLTNHGSLIKKSLFLRDKQVKIKLKTDNLDCACISKIMLMNSYQKKIKQDMIFIKKFINFNDLCGFGNFTIENLLIGIGVSLEKVSLKNYLQIIEEEFSQELKNYIYCYKSKVEILIYNLIPFIDYKFNISQENAYLMELFFLKKIYNKKALIDVLFDRYVGTLVSEDFIGVQIKKIINNF